MGAMLDSTCKTASQSTIKPRILHTILAKKTVFNGMTDTSNLTGGI